MIKKTIVARWISVTLLVANPQASWADAGGFARPTTSHPTLQVIKLKEGNAIRFFVQNLVTANITATFNLALVNLKASKTLPYTATFSPHTRVEVFRLTPIQEDVPWHYVLTNHFTLGSNRAVHDERCVYQLPYGANQAFAVSQAYHGHFSHQGSERYAIDWRMPEGTLICAAREGVIVDIKSDSTQGGPSKKYENLANYILIQHPDGTIGNYAHLQPNGAKVQMGQQVKTGQIIGRSGNTGYSNGPHLHFCVFKTKDGQERESIPVKFHTGNGLLTLSSGETYRWPAVYMAKAVSTNGF